MEKVERKSNIELLRIILIIFVIFEHYNNADIGGALRNPSELPFYNLLFLNLLDALSACAVDTFFLISGWFLIRRKEISIRKPINILLVYMVYNLLCYFLSVFVGEYDLSVRHIIAHCLPNSYYALIYCSIIIISPFINKLIKSLVDNELDSFLIIITILFILYPSVADFFCAKTGVPYINMSNISIDGNSGGYTIVNFLYMYIFGAFLHLRIEKKMFSHRKVFYLLGYLIITILIFVGSFINKHQIQYCNILVVIQSILLFLFFQKLSFQSRVVNSVSKSVWGVYCIHIRILWFWKLMKIDYYITSSFPYLIVNVLFSSLSVFLISVLFDKVFSLLLKPINIVIDKINFLNYKIKVC